MNKLAGIKACLPVLAVRTSYERVSGYLAISSLIHFFFGSLLPTVWLINFINLILNWDCVHKDYSVNIQKKIIAFLTSDCEYWSVLKWIFPQSIESRTKIFDQLSLIAFNVIWIQWLFWRCQCLLCNTFVIEKSEFKRKRSKTENNQKKDIPYLHDQSLYWEMWQNSSTKTYFDFFLISIPKFYDQIIFCVKKNFNSLTWSTKVLFKTSYIN